MRDAAATAGCSGKAPYLSWDHAKRAMARGRFNDRRGRGQMNIYRCRFCSFCHIGRAS